MFDNLVGMFIGAIVTVWLMPMLNEVLAQFANGGAGTG